MNNMKKPKRMVMLLSMLFLSVTILMNCGEGGGNNNGGLDQATDLLGGGNKQNTPKTNNNIALGKTDDYFYKFRDSYFVKVGTFNSTNDPNALAKKNELNNLRFGFTLRQYNNTWVLVSPPNRNIKDAEKTKKQLQETITTRKEDRESDITFFTIQANKENITWKKEKALRRIEAIKNRPQIPTFNFEVWKPNLPQKTQ